LNEPLWKLVLPRTPADEPSEVPKWRDANELLAPVAPRPMLDEPRAMLEPVAPRKPPLTPLPRKLLPPLKLREPPL
jgi:hypothetical protein